MFIMFIMYVGVWVPACMSVCVCACMCIVYGVPHTPTPTLTPIHPSTTPQGGTPRISQNSIELEQIKIIQFCLKI